MEYLYAQDNLSLGQMAARWVAREILAAPNLVLGLPTGSTPIGMCEYLARTLSFRIHVLLSFSQLWLCLWETHIYNRCEVTIDKLV